MYLFTSEVVAPGHPDKVADIIADSIVDKLIIGDSKSRVASEVFVAGRHIVIGGEVTSNTKVTTEDYKQIVHDALVNIGYDGNPYFSTQECLHPEDADVQVLLNAQSPDINQGVDQEDGETGAGDQGIMFGYACNETEVLMPAPIYYSHKILELMAADRKKGIADKLEPDSKSQITIEYKDGKPSSVKSVVISTQHSADVNQSQVRELVKPYIERSIPKELLSGLDENEIYVNPTGNFVIGGPAGDSGLTGRKIIVDTYGGAAPHGGGAFSGKDPTKVDRSAAYVSRYLAKNIVASKITNKCLIQLAYAIGVSKPLSIYVDLFDGDDEKSKHVKNLIKDNFDLSPRGIREMLGLNKPIYEKTAAYGHFGRDPESNGSFSWENTDKKAVFSK